MFEQEWSSAISNSIEATIKSSTTGAIDVILILIFDPCAYPPLVVLQDRELPSVSINTKALARCF